LGNRGMRREGPSGTPYFEPPEADLRLLYVRTSFLPADVSTSTAFSRFEGARWLYRSVTTTLEWPRSCATVFSDTPA